MFLTNFLDSLIVSFLPLFYDDKINLPTYFTRTLRKWYTVFFLKKKKFYVPQNSKNLKKMLKNVSNVWAVILIFARAL